MVGIYSYSIFEERRTPIVWCDNLDQITFGKPSPLSLTLMMSRAEVNQHHYFHPIQAFSLIWSVWHFLQPHLSHSKQTLNPFLLQKNLRFFFPPSFPYPRSRQLSIAWSQAPDEKAEKTAAAVAATTSSPSKLPVAWRHWKWCPGKTTIATTKKIQQ